MPVLGAGVCKGNLKHLTRQLLLTIIQLDVYASIYHTSRLLNSITEDFKALPKKYNYLPLSVCKVEWPVQFMYVRKKISYPFCVDFQARHGYTIDPYRYKFADASLKCSRH